MDPTAVSAYGFLWPCTREEDYSSVNWRVVDVSCLFLLAMVENEEKNRFDATCGFFQGVDPKKNTTVWRGELFKLGWDSQISENFCIRQSKWSKSEGWIMLHQFHIFSWRILQSKHRITGTCAPPEIWELSFSLHLSLWFMHAISFQSALKCKIPLRV